jgi:vacuolar-type H+-ATPase subunit I/STV1
MMNRRTTSRGLLLLALALAGGTAPLAAQEEQAEPLTRERLTEFARAHLAINEVRDEFHGEVARVHDEEGRTRAREQVEEKIASILEEHELTREEFDEITLRISLDGELRAMFDEILVELAEEGT